MSWFFCQPRCTENKFPWSRITKIYKKKSVEKRITITENFADHEERKWPIRPLSTVDLWLFLRYQCLWILWVKTWTTNLNMQQGKKNKGLYADFGKTMKSDILENSISHNLCKLLPRNKWINSMLIVYNLIKVWKIKLIYAYTLWYKFQTKK